jgi:hypothetical protein
MLIFHGFSQLQGTVTGLKITHWRVWVGAKPSAFSAVAPHL